MTSANINIGSHWELQLLGMQKCQNLQKSLIQNFQRFLFIGVEKHWNSYVSALQDNDKLREAFLKVSFSKVNVCLVQA